MNLINDLNPYFISFLQSKFIIKIINDYPPTAFIERICDLGGKDCMQKCSRE